MNKEKLAEIIMAQAESDGEPVTKEEALEMAEMEIKAGNIPNYTETEKVKNKTRKSPTKDPIKVAIISALAEWIKTYSDVEEVEITNTQRKVEFILGDGVYELTLVKHRPSK